MAHGCISNPCWICYPSLRPKTAADDPFLIPAPVSANLPAGTVVMVSLPDKISDTTIRSIEDLAKWLVDNNRVTLIKNVGA